MRKSIINKLEEGIISFLLASMTLLVFVEVILRFVFATGVLWAQEMTLHISAWMVLFGASYGVKVGSHIGVDAVVKVLPSKIARVVSLVGVALCLVYCGLFLRGSWVYLAKMYKIGIPLTDIAVPRWAAHSILFIGMLLLAVRLIQLGIKIIRGEAEGFKLLDEAKDSMYLIQEAKEEAAREYGEEAQS